MWNAAFEGLKPHEPMYGIVVHGVPIANLDVTQMADTAIIKRIKGENHIGTRTITKITPLRRKRRIEDKSKTKLHHSIVVYLNNQHTANKCITNGFYVDYLHYAAEKFVPQYQLMQCFNCCDYGHKATSCKRHSRCGKCGKKHNTRECTSTKAQCFHCKGSHEAWHSECPANIAEKAQLEELSGNASYIFN